MKDPQERELWTAYNADRSNVEARNRLADFYYPFVCRMAKSQIRRVPSNAMVFEGDLLTYGMLGLMQAIERFDLARNLKFLTFASSRVRGAMIDGLREMDYVRPKRRTFTKRATECPAVYHVSSREHESEDSGRIKPMDVAAPQLPDRAELRDQVKAALRGLSQLERVVVTEYYCHGESMYRIGKSLNLSEGRISQMMTSIRQRIKERWPNGIDAA